MKIVKDEATGLPKVDDNQFWRIRDSDIFNDPKIELRRKAFIGSYLIADSYIWNWVENKDDEELYTGEFMVTYADIGEKLTHDNIYISAGNLLLDHYKKNKKRMDYEASVKKFHGDYPPKRLETK